jgi:hypothetical protein
VRATHYPRLLFFFLLLFLGGIGCDERGKGPEEEEGEEKKRRKRRKRGKRRGRGEEEEKGRRGDGEKGRRGGGEEGRRGGGEKEMGCYMGELLEKGGRNVLVLLMIKVLRRNITRSARLEI